MDAREYWDRVKGCWIGKSAGGTLGMPFEGKREVNHVSFYTQGFGEPAPNDDLDLQLVWLKVLEENGVSVDSVTLASYWLDYIIVDWNEYGVARDNIRKGIMPPMSGKFRNGWQHSNGGWIRSEIWGSVFAGMPQVAAQYGLMDASVDHGDGEGAYAEAFTAFMDSMAYFEGDVKKLIRDALVILPQQSGVRKAVNAALDSYERGLSWLEARDNVIAASEETGWFQAPRNLGYVAIGLLYGEGDFGKTVCTAVNCGDDTDCTGATAGAIMGIIKGEKGIPNDWKSYIGEEIKTVAIGGFQPPKTITELTNRTVAIGLYAHSLHGLADVSRGEIYPSPVSASPPSVDARRVELRQRGLSFALNFRGGIEAPPNSSLGFDLIVGNSSKRAVSFSLKGEGLDFEKSALRVESGQQGTVRVRADVTKYGFNRYSITVTTDDGCYCVPFALFGTLTPSGMSDRASSNIAVEYKDALAVDEQGRPAGGVIHAIVTDDPSRTFHFNSSPPPHEVTISFPSEKTASEVVINFTSRGRPVDFSGYVLKDNAWEKIFEEHNYADPIGYRKLFSPIRISAFKLVIYRVEGGNAAELSQIEIY
ncbi:MAG: ADP-ribosylglycohydrolase family protein [Thermoprotei archaeon]